MKDSERKRLKDEIKIKQERLNKIIVGKTEKKEILNISQELDILISQFLVRKN